jgi:hypothetical protein
MASALVLEFAGAGRDLYEAVNAKLGIDTATGAGDWPDGLLSHAASEGERGLTVLEVWDSQASQERFMQTRLGAALQEAGITEPPSRMEWLDLLSYLTPAPAPA